MNGLRAVQKVSLWVCVAIACAYIALWIAVAYLRLVYPYEVEWMEGAMLDHAVRILHGQPIYTAPSIDFVAWLYPPLYYYAVAAAMKIVGVGFFAGRIVSVISTGVTATLLAVITKKISGDRLLAFFTAALYPATYHATGFYFDIARNDAFFTMLLVATAYAALISRERVTTLSSIVTALLLCAAIATKQQALLFFPALAIWFWLRDKRTAITFALTTIVITAIGYLAINAATHGWLAYYLLQIPKAKRADFVWLRTLDVFPQFAFGPFAASTLALFALVARAAKEQRAFWKSATGLLALMTISAIIAGAMSLGNEGGYANVMMPFAAFVIPFLPIAIGQFGFAKQSPLSTFHSPLSTLLVLFQFLAFYFNPLSEKMLIASEHQRHGGDEFFQRLRAIPGDVLIPYHGFIGGQANKPTHAHVLASIDVLRMHDTTARRLQADFDSALARHRYSAVILEESPLLPRDSIQHYTFGGVMLAEPNVYLTRIRDDATRPEFIFVPK